MNDRRRSLGAGKKLAFAAATMVFFLVGFVLLMEIGVRLFVTPAMWRGRWLAGLRTSRESSVLNRWNGTPSNCCGTVACELGFSTTCWHHKRRWTNTTWLIRNRDTWIFPKDSRLTGLNVAKLVVTNSAKRCASHEKSSEMWRRCVSSRIRASRLFLTS